MTIKTLLLTTILLALQTSFFGQQLNESIFNAFKTKIESKDFPPFQGAKLKFNGSNFLVNTNEQRDTLIIERIKIIEDGYSDPSNDREIRSVAFKDIDFKSTSIKKGDDFYFFEIFTKEKQNVIRYTLIRGEKINFADNNTLGIGRFSKTNTSYKDMVELLELFTKIYN